MQSFNMEFYNNLSSLLGMNISLFSIDKEDYIINSFSCCEKCSADCDHRRTHLYGSYEAQRWGGKYIYYCPAGYIFLSSITDNTSENTSVITGPIIMGDLSDFENGIDAVTACSVNLSTAQVNSLSTLMECYTKASAKESKTPSEDSFDKHYQTAKSESSSYAIELEKKLGEAIKNGDSAESRMLLNKLLGNIYFSSSNNLEVIKSRALELVVMLSRSAIDGGADIQKILLQNSDYIKQVSRFSSVEELSIWLTKVINRFIDYVFEFSEIKHRDTLFKVTGYIKTNYMNRISLEDVAAHVFMSKTYLSKIFKEELGCKFTEYVNRVRIEKSRALLKDSSFSLAEISNLCGFEEQAYFSKVFKNDTGLTPGKYREKYINR